MRGDNECELWGPRQFYLNPGGSHIASYLCKIYTIKMNIYVFWELSEGEYREMISHSIEYVNLCISFHIVYLKKLACLFIMFYLYLK